MRSSVDSCGPDPTPFIDGLSNEDAFRREAAAESLGSIGSRVPLAQAVPEDHVADHPARDQGQRDRPGVDLEGETEDPE